jgi:hypothetical protein
MTKHSDDPGYHALRLGADWASAVRGNTIYFDFDSGDQRLAITQPAPMPAPAGPVRVSTPPSALSRPLVTAITLSTKEYGPMKLAGTCSAAFWSESAVEKFLFPYYASAAGHQAQEVLSAISSAWYHYDDRSPVCALTFQYMPEAMVGPMALWNTVGVVFGTWEAGKPVLQVLPLREYIARKGMHGVEPPLPPEVPMPTVRADPSSETTPVDSVGAREVAEYVSGLRGHEVMVYRSEEKIGGLEPTLTPLPAADGSAPLFIAHAPVVRPDRPKVSAELTVKLKVSVEEPTPGGSKKKEEWKEMPFPLTAIGGSPANDPDSAFWTDGAVEMLMLPYYASVEGGGAPWYLMALWGSGPGASPPRRSTPPGSSGRSPGRCSGSSGSRTRRSWRRWRESRSRVRSPATCSGSSTSRARSTSTSSRRTGRWSPSPWRAGPGS